MKVYVVRCEYDNGESYEDNFTCSTIEAVCATREIAEAYIKNIKLPDKWVDGDPYDGACENDAIRKTYESGEHTGEWSNPPTENYFVDEYDLLRDVTELFAQDQ